MILVQRTPLLNIKEKVIFCSAVRPELWINRVCLSRRTFLTAPELDGEYPIKDLRNSVI